MCKEQWAYRGLGYKMNGIGINEDYQMMKVHEITFKVAKKRIHQITAMKTKGAEYTKHNTHNLHSESE